MPLEASSSLLVAGVLPAAEDHLVLGNILTTPDWQFDATTTIRSAYPLLSNPCIGAVLSESTFPDGRTWKDVLLVLRETADPPPLIVVDRLADERLWAEVLNLGAYDLLAKPFVATEVLHAVSAACRWRESQGRVVSGGHLVKHSTGASDLAALVRAATARY